LSRQLCCIQADNASALFLAMTHEGALLLAAEQLPSPLLAVYQNVTAHPSTANVPITILLYSDPLLCGFDVPIKGLRNSFHYHVELIETI